MIISASYKTDIPAFYGEWLVNRLAAGFCMMRNPLNKKPIRVSLAHPDASGIVFWTKNFRPFMRYVDAVVDYNMPFVVQYTINGYPASLEHNVVEWRRSVDTVCALARRFGQRCVVWRYDTIVESLQTPFEFHVDNFARIAEGLAGSVDEVVISFMQVYRKTRMNMDAMSLSHANRWTDPTLERKRELAATLHRIAAERGIDLTICSQPDLITVQRASRCIDADRLTAVAGREIAATIQGNRPGCECAGSRDIGAYDTCPHGCVYCYAVRDNLLAIQRHGGHNPLSEYLFNDEPPITESERSQLRLEI